ncbi:unnamed protein product [Amaranthus hypochondriacus]
MDYSSRPNRSDVHLSLEEEHKIEEETKEYFDGLAPKRHSKPQRSEHSTNYVDVNNNSLHIPEFLHFQRLQNDQQKLMCENGGEVTDEFVETEYYKDLNCVDKQHHHTTGKGFIKMENENGNSYSLAPDSDLTHHASTKGNPATNEWIPSTDDQVTIVSEKPNRSET